jgi:hypothetical protein
MTPTRARTAAHADGQCPLANVYAGRAVRPAPPEVEQRFEESGCPKFNLQVRVGNEAIWYAEDEVVSFGERLIDDQYSTPYLPFGARYKPLR